MQCICGKFVDVTAYGFHKCNNCGRVYGCDANGIAYIGKDKYKISEKKILNFYAKCCNGKDEEERTYFDPVLKGYHTKDCIEREINWLKEFKHWSEDGMWKGLMTWDERIAQLQQVIGENNDKK